MICCCIFIMLSNQQQHLMKFNFCNHYLKQIKATLCLKKMLKTFQTKGLLLQCIIFGNLFQKSLPSNYIFKFYYQNPLRSLHGKAIRILLLASVKSAGPWPNVPLSLASIIHRKATRESSKIKVHASGIEAELI